MMDPIKNLLKSKPKVINIGLRSFFESLKDQNNQAVHINWKPPAGGKKRLLEILKKIQ